MCHTQLHSEQASLLGHSPERPLWLPQPGPQLGQVHHQLLVFLQKVPWNSQGYPKQHPSAPGSCTHHSYIDQHSPTLMNEWRLQVE